MVALDSSAQGDHKENYSVGEDNSSTCKGVVKVSEFMQLQVENDLHEDVELQSELRHALDVQIDEHENTKISSQSNVKSIVAYVEVGESRFSSVHLLVN